MSDRLTKSARESIAAQLIEKAFGEKKAMDARKKAVFKLLIDDYHRDHKAVMKKLPKGALPVANYITIIYLGNEPNIHLEGPETPVFKSFFEYGSVARYSMDSLQKKLSPEVFATLKSLVADIRAYHNEKRKFSSDVEAVLESVTTYKRLYEVWPEVAQVKPPIESPKRATGQQLAPVTSHLTAALGLVPSTPKPVK